MAGIEITSRGTLLDGRAAGVVGTQLRAWTQGTLRLLRDHARSIAPVLTGRYRQSITYRTRMVGANGVEGELSSTDVPGKTRVIEYGFPAARPDLRGRQGRFVFQKTAMHGAGLLNSQARVLETTLARELSR
jgi:hypothetical protein